jgi:hypothetical protein
MARCSCSERADDQDAPSPEPLWPNPDLRSLDAAVKQLMSRSLVLNGPQAELASVALKTTRAVP